jgi:4-amino-4-deoxy-L-arabinose transferase-like glycosyltransferase
MPGEALALIALLPMALRSATALSPRQRLGIILAAALVLRLAILAMTTQLSLKIVDEQHYHVLATSMVEGRGMASASGPTSLRPPVYPALVAGLWSVSGSRSLQVVRVFQDLLGLATAVLVYWIGRRLYDNRTALVAAGITAFYPALVLANSLFLTETVFTFLLTAFVAALIALLQRPRPAVAVSAGLLLGLAALTRSIVWPLPLVLVPFLAWIAPATFPRRLMCCALLLAAYAAVLLPWAVRNTRLQGVPVVVDTMGGMNLRMGNYEFTPHDRIWDAVSQRGPQSWIVGIPPHPPGRGEWTEGEKERWARQQALAFMVAHPSLTIWRAVIKFSDFWALDRDYMAAIQRGMYHPPVWAAVVATAAMTAAFPLVIGLAIVGICLRPPADWRSHLLLILLVLFVTALHSVVFGHPRYRLPLTPILAVYAGAAVSARAWRRLFEGWRVALLPVVLALGLVAIWTTQFVVRDWPLVKQLLGGAPT